MTIIVRSMKRRQLGDPAHLVTIDNRLASE